MCEKVIINRNDISEYSTNDECSCEKVIIEHENIFECVIKNGKECKENINDIFPYYLNYVCEISGDVTLRDIAKHINRHREFFDIIQKRNFVLPWVDAILGAKRSEKPKDQEPQTIQCFVINPHLEINNLIDDKSVNLTYSFDFEGGIVTEQFVESCQYTTVTKDHIGLPMIFGLGDRVLDYVDYRIRYNHLIPISKWWEDSVNDIHLIYEKNNDVSITANDLIECIFSEISFMGTPEDCTEEYKNIYKKFN